VQRFSGRGTAFAQLLGITLFNLLHEFPELEEVRAQAINELPRPTKRWLSIVFEKDVASVQVLLEKL